MSKGTGRVARTRALIFPIHGSFVRPWIHDVAKSKEKPTDGWYGRKTRVWASYGACLSNPLNVNNKSRLATLLCMWAGCGGEAVGRYYVSSFFLCHGGSRAFGEDVEGCLKSSHAKEHTSFSPLSESRVCAAAFPALKRDLEHRRSF